MGTLLVTGGGPLVSQPPTRRGEDTDRGTRTSGVTGSIVRRAQVGSPRSGLKVQSASELGDVFAGGLALAIGTDLAIAATSPGYAAANAYGTTYAIDAPPPETASCATTTAAAATPADKEATSTSSATAARATTAAASPTSPTSATPPTATSAAASSGELNTRCEGTTSFRVKDAESSEAYV